MTIQTNWELIL